MSSDPQKLELDCRRHSGKCFFSVRTGISCQFRILYICDLEIYIEIWLLHFIQISDGNFPIKTRQVSFKEF